MPTRNLFHRQPLLAYLLFLSLVFLLPALACKEDYVEPEEISAADLSGRHFAYKSLFRANLSHKNLRNADFTRADLENTDLSYSDCTGAIFDWADFNGANLTYTILDEKWDRIRVLLTTRSSYRKDFSGYDLSKTHLRYVNLAGADLSSANMAQAHLMYANLAGANLSSANMTRAN